MTNSLPLILVTGANGQLGSEIKKRAVNYPGFLFVFLSREELPIDQIERVRHFFEERKPAYCVNCAAYTAVDKAETDRETAMLINADSAGVLAAVCAVTGTRFIHISTDYVFDGTATEPYTETDAPHPVNYYGATKLRGEELCVLQNPASIIIRTAWVYSEFGNNFVKTMVRLMKEKEAINVVSDQVGTPTYGADLAAAILHIISLAHANSDNWQPGIYHYSNEGKISWFDFAVAIKEITNSPCQVLPITTALYPTPAKRPAFSVFDKEKIKSTYRLFVPAWKDSLAICLSRMGVAEKK